MSIIPRELNSLSQAAFESSVLGNYWEIYFPKVAYAHQRPSSHDIGSWVINTQQNYARESLVKTSLLAVCLVSLGRRTGEQSFIVAGVEAYCRALRETNRLLQSSENWGQDSLLAACKFLALYEVSIIFTVSSRTLAE